MNFYSENNNNSSDVCINDYLPNEILEEIFLKLNQSDLSNSKFVCQRWRVLIDDNIGHKITVSSYYFLFPYMSVQKGNKIKSRHNINNLVNFEDGNTNFAIRDLTIGISEMLAQLQNTSLDKLLWNKPLEFPQLLFPHALKRLTCNEPIDPQIFDVLKPLRNLTYLNLSLVSLASLKEDSFHTFEPLMALSTLVISNPPSYPNFLTTSAMLKLNTFLNQLCVPNLITLDISYPVIYLLHPAENDCTLQIINLMWRTLTIQHLSISVASPTQNYFSPSKDDQYPHDILDKMAQLGKTIQLKSITLRDNHVHCLRPSSQVKAWTVFMKQQCKLESLRIVLKSSIELSTDVAVILINNVDTLMTLELSCFPCEIDEDNDFRYVVIEDGHIADCHRLKRLTLYDRISGTKLFPTSLQYIMIDSLLTNEDAAHLLLDYEGNLEQITFKDLRGGAPKGMGFGVLVKTLQELAVGNARNKVKRLVVYVGCTDGKFPEEGIPNEDVISPGILRKRRPPFCLGVCLDELTTEAYDDLIKYVRLDWKLNERGFYEDNLVHVYNEFCKVALD